MITLSHLGDRNDRRVLSVNMISEDQKSRWDMKLTTGDIPPRFENSQSRDVKMTVVDRNEITADKSNVFFLPLKSNGVMVLDDEVRQYYVQASSNYGDISPGLSLDGYITVSKDGFHLIEDPYLKLELVVMEDTNNQQSQTNDQYAQASGQQFSSTNARGDFNRPHVDKNENSNGGLDLALGDHKNEAAEQNRENREVRTEADHTYA